MSRTTWGMPSHHRDILEKLHHTQTQQTMSKLRHSFVSGGTTRQKASNKNVTEYKQNCFIKTIKIAAGAGEISLIVMKSLPTTGRNADGQLSVSLKRRRKWPGTSGNHRGGEARVTAAAAALKQRHSLNAASNKHRLGSGVLNVVCRQTFSSALQPNMDTKRLSSTWAEAECARQRLTMIHAEWSARRLLHLFYCNNRESKCVLSAAAVPSWLALRSFCNNLFMPEVKYEHRSFKSPPCWIIPFFFFGSL